jgi:hypothetical protein
MTDNSQALMLALQAGSLYGPNKWSQFPNGIQSTGYSGTPTNALGQPIQQPPGMTLNQTPAQPQTAPAPAAPQQAPIRMASQPNGMPQGWNQNSNNGGIFITPTQQSQPQQQAAASAPVPQPAASSPTNSYQNALQLLSNPGHVTTPGANVAATQPITQQPSVLDQFLATQQGGTGAGGYSNQGFFNTLNRLKGNNAPAVADANTAPAALSPGANMTDQLAGVKPQVRRA